MTDGPSGRRRAILDAALQAFVENGYAATTVDQVRRASGASTGSMYHHFAGKEQLAAAVYLYTLDSYYDAWEAQLDGRSPATVIRAVVIGHFDWLAGNTDKASFLFVNPPPEQMSRTDSGVAHRLATFRQRLLAWLAPHVQARKVLHLPDDVYEPLWVGPAQLITRQSAGWPEGMVALRRFAPQLAKSAKAALLRH